jgi:hypothetical protein
VEQLRIIKHFISAFFSRRDLTIIECHVFAQIESSFFSEWLY